ncbi:MAG: HlyC/CorC family transporter [Myxococcales bacterium]|nr:HlyC/CorC family transporter [Myxococcales bacterium]
MSDLIYLTIIVVCVVISAFFSGSETALFRLRSHEIEKEIESARGPAAVAVRDLLSSSSRLLVTILLGNNVVNILGASAAAALSIRHFGPQLGIVISTVVMTILVLVLCEVLPKAVAAQHPVIVARTIGLPLYIFHGLMRPVHSLFDRIIEPVVQRIAHVSGDAADRHSAEGVLRFAREAREGDQFGSPLAIIGATSDAAQMDVTEIMVQRTEIVAFSVDTPPATLLESVLDERYTRVPIFEESIDHVLGIAHLKDVIRLVNDERGDVRGILKPILRVPERKPILRLLADMQRSFCHVALVKDEFGVTLGLVTQEDILEEIVGEIRDEFDFEELLTIRKLGDESYEVLGRVSVLDFNRETSWRITAEKGDTLAGLFFNTLGRSPRRGESVELSGYELICLDVSGSRITRLRVIQKSADDDSKFGDKSAST